MIDLLVICHDLLDRGGIQRDFLFQLLDVFFYFLRDLHVLDQADVHKGIIVQLGGEHFLILGISLTDDALLIDQTLTK